VEVRGVVGLALIAMLMAPLAIGATSLILPYLGDVAGCGYVSASIGLTPPVRDIIIAYLYSVMLKYFADRQRTNLIIIGVVALVLFGVLIAAVVYAAKT